jgi:F420-0:gamma-glutamyl ligase
MLSEVTPHRSEATGAGERSRSTSLLSSLLTLKRRASTAPSAAATGSAQHDVNKSLGVILTANAGMDESNTPEGTAIGWPEDPVKSAKGIRQRIMQNSDQFLVSSCWLLVRKIIRNGIFGKLKTNNYQLTTRRLAVLITDSCVRPRRWGVVAFALTCAGIDPFKDEAGNDDLFGKKLKITREATADQLATAANMLMGNAGQSVPAVIIRDHGLTLSDYEGWVPGIDPEEDLFKGIV